MRTANLSLRPRPTRPFWFRQLAPLSLLPPLTLTMHVVTRPTPYTAADTPLIPPLFPPVPAIVMCPPHRGFTEIVRALIKAGADPSSGVHIGPVGPLIAQYTPLGRACAHSTQPSPFLLSHSRLSHRSSNRNPNDLLPNPPIALLSSLADIRSTSIAGRNGHTGTMLALLEAGADPNVGLSLGPFGTIGSYSLLGHASAHGAPVLTG